MPIVKDIERRIGEDRRRSRYDRRMFKLRFVERFYNTIHTKRQHPKRRRCWDRRWDERDERLGLCK